MKKALIIILIIACLAGAVYIYLINTGHTNESILNTPNKIALNVKCGEVENMLVTSIVKLTVNNNSSREHKNVTIRVVAYDKKRNTIKEQETVFLRTLTSHGNLTKTVTLPAKTKSCDCVVLNSTPQ